MITTTTTEPTQRVTETPAETTPTWKTLYSTGSFGSVDNSKVEFNHIFHEAGSGIARRECADCSADHQDIYFKRKTQPSEYDAWEGLMVTWRGDVNFHTDFDLYSSLEDALADRNAWQFCNGNNPNIGFPGDCGPSSGIAFQWQSFVNRQTRQNYKWSVYVNKNTSATNGMTTEHLKEEGMCATDFVASGCYSPENLMEIPSSLTPILRMTVEKCFERCKRLPGIKYFALTGGNACHCSQVLPGAKLERDEFGRSACDTKCEGNPGQTCGGESDAASVYAMYDCGQTEEDKREEAAEDAARVVASYSKVEGTSCAHSDGNVAEINRSPTMNGSPETCMEACWYAYSSFDCMGFTYDEVARQCTFVNDVTDGTVTKSSELHCYFKKLV